MHYVLEVNTNPALHTDCPYHATMLPMLVEHTLEAVLHTQPVVSRAAHARRTMRSDGAATASEANVSKGGAVDGNSSGVRRAIGGLELIVDEEAGYEYEYDGRHKS
jgi:hypothetical protein